MSKLILESDEVLKNTEALKKTLEHFEIISKDMVSIFSTNKVKNSQIKSIDDKKIRNFDKTVTTIPTSALITNGVQNWRGMEETKGRRIMILQKSQLIEISELT